MNYGGIAVPKALKRGPDNPGGQPISEPPSQPTAPGPKKFGPGNNANPNGRKGKQPEYSAVPADESMPQGLRDMWHVYCRPKAEDKTFGQIAYRRIAEKDPDKFLGTFTREQAKFEEWVKKLPGREEPGVDEGAEKAIALCDRLLELKPWEDG